MKILMISHTCMSRTMGQPKLHALAAHPDVDLTALVPDRMNTYGTWKTAEAPDAPPFRFVVGRTRWQNLMNQWYLLHYADSLTGLLRDGRPDVVDIWEEPWSLACAQTVALARRHCPQAKIIVETEQNTYKRLPPPFQQFQTYSLRHADSVVARNSEAVAVLRRKGYAGPVSVVPNAVECGLFQPQPAPERAVRRRDLGWGAPQDFVFGYVGRLVPEKGIADALDALDALPGNARLAVIGDAAHAMPSALGQGAGVSMLNAVMLARAMAAASDVPAGLADWEAKARPVVEGWQREAEGVASSRTLAGAVHPGEDFATERRIVEAAMAPESHP